MKDYCGAILIRLPIQQEMIGASSLLAPPFSNRSGADFELLNIAALSQQSL